MCCRSTTKGMAMRNRNKDQDEDVIFRMPQELIDQKARIDEMPPQEDDGA